MIRDIFNFLFHSEWEWTICESRPLYEIKNKSYRDMGNYYTFHWDKLLIKVRW